MTTAADGIAVERDVRVPMSDGTVLRANVFRPEGAGPFPVLVTRTPYGKGEKVDERLVQAGYIVVMQDARGRYASDGEFESMLRAETHDGSDGRDTMEWAAKLPGSNGKVGLFGTSYPGFLAWRGAGAKPESLKAMAAWSFPASYLSLEGPGTIRPGRRLRWWGTSISPDVRRRTGGAAPHTVAEANKLWESGEGDKLLRTLPWSQLPDEVFATEAPFVRAWLREPWRDPLHLDQDAANTSVPNLNLCGWYDHCIGSIDLHQAISKHGAAFAAKRFSRLIVGPWSHSALGKRKQGEIDFGPNAELDLTQLYLDWFGKWLKDEPTGVDHSAPVRLFVMGANEWRNFFEWPPKYAAPQAWWLDSGGGANTPAGDGRLLGAAPAEERRDEYDYDPRDPVPTLWSPAMFTGPAVQNGLAQRRDMLVYQTPPLEAYVEAIGYPEVLLHASSRCPDTDFFARLIDVGPDGTAIDVTAGMVRAQYRNSLEKSELLTPGEPVEFRIKLRPTAHRFLAGHRIRLDVTSSDFPNYDRNHNTAADQNNDAELVTARQTVFHGGMRASQLILPVMREKSEVPRWAEGRTKIPPPRFVMSFGTPGDGPGEFHSPIGIAIDSHDEIYVTEFHTHRVQVFDTSGKQLRMFAVDGQPGGIAVDKEGHVYVAPLLGHRIDVFDREGKALHSFGKQGSGDGEFQQPGGIAIAADGTVYVVDQANHRIQRFKPDGTFLGAWGKHGSAPGEFGGEGPAGSRLSGPHFAAFDAEGCLWTTEGANLRVQKFDANGKPLFAFSGAGDGPGCFGGRPADRTNPFEGPIGITIDHQGRVWVSSTNNRVQCFAQDGTFLTGIGDEGIEPGEFIIPHALAFDSAGYLYVVDASNQRVQKFEVR